MFRLRQPVLLGLLQPASLQWFLGVNKLYQLCNWEYLRDPGHHTDTQRLPSSHHFRNLVVDPEPQECLELRVQGQHNSADNLYDLMEFVRLASDLSALWFAGIVKAWKYLALVRSPGCFSLEWKVALFGERSDGSTFSSISSAPAPTNVQSSIQIIPLILESS